MKRPDFIVRGIALAIPRIQQPVVEIDKLRRKVDKFLRSENALT
jgi:hypothetical protein